MPGVAACTHTAGVLTRHAVWHQAHHRRWACTCARTAWRAAWRRRCSWIRSTRRSQVRQWAMQLLLDKKYQAFPGAAMGHTVAVG